MVEMNHLERILATIQGEKPDRIPVSMWRHFYTLERDPQTLSEALLGFQKKYDWDFMKINPRASYFMEAWGVEVEYTGNKRPKTTHLPIKTSDDWKKVKPIKPEEGVLGEHLKLVEYISKGIEKDLPFIMTVFTPPTLAAKLMSKKKNFADHFIENEREVKEVLDIITQTVVDFCMACLQRGVSGFFIPISWPDTEKVSEDTYRQFIRPYEIKMISALKDAEFNMLHVCGDFNVLSYVSDYPVHAFNWDSRGEGNPSLKEGKAMIGDKIAAGGMPFHKELAEFNPEQLTNLACELHNEMGDKGWILAPGCTFSGEASEEDVRAIRNSVNKFVKLY